MAFQVGLEGFELLGGDHDLAVGGDDRPIVGRIEGEEFIDRHPRQAGGGLDVDGLSRAHRSEIGLVFQGGQAQFRHQARVAENVLERLQLGDVVAGLGGHAEAGEVGGQPPGKILSTARLTAFSPQL